MEEIKHTVARNIAELRQNAGMTQIELAEKLNYSDKAVSKWERGESLPDVTVLCAVAALFGVSLDYLVTRDHAALPQEPSSAPTDRRVKRNHAMITGMSMLLVWFVATLTFVVVDVSVPEPLPGLWLAFIYAVPVSSIVWLVFNTIWFDRRRNFFIISLLMWTLLAAMHLTFVACGANPWQLYMLGIPGQIIIVMWSVLSFRH